MSSIQSEHENVSFFPSLLGQNFFIYFFFWKIEKTKKFFRNTRPLVTIFSVSVVSVCFPAGNESYSSAFLKGPQKCAQLSLWFWNLLSERQKHEDDCTSLCCLLREAELYHSELNLLGFVKLNEAINSFSKWYESKQNKHKFSKLRWLT